MALNSLKLIAKPYFSSESAARLGVSSRMLAYYAARGRLIRVSHGVYCFPGDQDLSLLGIIREKLSAVPKGVVGMRTALRLHGLGEEVPGTIDILVPDTNVPKRKIADVAFHRVKAHLISASVNKHQGVRVTSLERTLVDLLRAGEPLAFVLNVFNEAKAKNIPIRLPLIRQLGRKLRAKAKTERFLEAVL